MVYGVVLALLLVFLYFFDVKIVPRDQSGTAEISGGANAPEEALNLDPSYFKKQVISDGGAVLNIKWGDLGKKLVEKGVIDMDKMEELYAGRGGLDDFEKSLLDGGNNGEITINERNAPFILNMFWAFGLANTSSALNEGPMHDYSDTGNFASTGGWTLSKGDAMNHYGKYNFLNLTEDQEMLVNEVAMNIYRPCCNNSTYFPDCNHGMAMLGFLELLAANGAGADEMYEQALLLNSYWFPDTYVNLAKFFYEKDGIAWQDVDAKTALGVDYSSSSGYRQVLATIEPELSKGGGSCGV